MKKFYNFLKREAEREEWERAANPEDIEYAKCQEELGEQLLETVTQVERVIGEQLSVSMLQEKCGGPGVRNHVTDFNGIREVKGEMSVGKAEVGKVQGSVAHAR